MILNTFIFSFYLLCNATDSADKNIIVWSENHNLNWSSFLGKPLNTSPYGAVSANFIISNIAVNGDTLLFTVETRFDKSKSWVKDYSRTEEVLNHEQSHFDLTEIYSRKLRKQISESLFTRDNLDLKFNSYFDKYLEELKDAQNQYDLDTDFSNDRASQLIWDKKIKEELNQLIEFASPDLYSNILSKFNLIVSSVYKGFLEAISKMDLMKINNFSDFVYDRFNHFVVV